MSPIAKLRSSCALLPCLALLASVAHAAPPATPLASSLAGDAKAAYDSGKLLLGDHDYAGAATKFRAAFEASHDPRLLWNIAVCEKELRHYARASALVDRFVTEAGATMDPEMLEQARASQEALKQFFSAVPLAVEPAGARVTIDGEDVGQAPFPQPVRLDIGAHVIRAAREGFSPAEKRVQVTGLNVTPITLSLTALPALALAFLAVHPSDPVDLVAVDEQAAGKGEWSGSLVPGAHRVRVTAVGKQPHLTEITLAAGEHRSLDVTLENEEKKATLWPWLVGGGAVLVAGAAVGGYFLFKPGDTTASFPDNKLGTVYLSAPRTGVRR